MEELVQILNKEAKFNEVLDLAIEHVLEAREAIAKLQSWASNEEEYTQLANIEIKLLIAKADMKIVSRRHGG